MEQAKIIALLLNIIGGILAAWALLLPKPYNPICISCILFPVFALFPYYYYKGLIKILDSRNSPNPSLIYALIGPSVVLGLRALIDYDILDTSSAAIYCICATIPMAIALVANKKAVFENDLSHPAQSIVLAFVAAMSWAYGTIIFINCSYDNSKPAIHSAWVQDKYMHNGKHKSYYIIIEGDNKKYTGKHTIGRSLYDRLEIGRSVYVYELDGRLSIQWLIITD